MRSPSVSGQACHGAALAMTETDLLPMEIRRAIATLSTDSSASAGVGVVTHRCRKEKQLVANAVAGAACLHGEVCQRKLRSFGIWEFRGTLLDVHSARLGGTCRALCWMFALKLPNI